MSLRQRTLRGIGWKGAASVSRQLVSFAVTVGLARLLAPEDFGLMAMTAVAIQLAALVHELGFAAALVQHEAPDERHRSSVFWLQATTGLVLAGGVAAAAPCLAQLLSEPRLVLLIRVAACGLLAGSLAAVHRSLLERALDFRRLARIELAAVATGGLAALGGAAAGLGALALALQFVVSQVASAGGLWLAGRWRPRPIVDRRALRELLGFSSSLVGYRLFNYCTRNADTLLVGRFLGSGALGFYTTAYRVMLLPLGQVTHVLQAVMFPALSRIQHDPERVRAIYLRANAIIGLVTIPAVSGLFVLADPFVRLLLGDRWAPAAPLIQLLCLAAVKQPLGATTGWIYQCMGRTDLMLRWGIVGGVVTIAGFAVGLHWGVTGVAASYALTRYLLWYPGISIPGRLIGLGFGRFLGNVAGSFGCAVAMAALVAALGRWLPADWPLAASVGLRVAAGVAFYAALVHGLGLSAYRDARALLAEQWGRPRPVPSHAWTVPASGPLGARQAGPVSRGPTGGRDAGRSPRPRGRA